MGVNIINGAGSGADANNYALRVNNSGAALIGALSGASMFPLRVNTAGELLTSASVGAINTGSESYNYGKSGTGWLALAVTSAGVLRTDTSVSSVYQTSGNVHIVSGTVTTVSNVTSAYIKSGANLDMTGSVVVTNTVSVAGSQAITNTVAVSGNQVSLKLTTGSWSQVALGSNSWVRVAPITEVRSWAVSVEGAAPYDISTMSGTTMISHNVQSGTIWSEDSTPAHIMIRAHIATSGTVQQNAP